MICCFRQRTTWGNTRIPTETEWKYTGMMQGKAREGFVNATSQEEAQAKMSDMGFVNLSFSRVGTDTQPRDGKPDSSERMIVGIPAKTVSSVANSMPQKRRQSILLLREPAATGACEFSNDRLNRLMGELNGCVTMMNMETDANGKVVLAVVVEHDVERKKLPQA